MNTRIPKKKTVLISGIDGFLGYNLFHEFKSNYTILGIQRQVESFLRIKDEDLLENVKIYEVNYLTEIFDNNHIDIVIHTATHHCKENYTISDVYQTNMTLGLRLFELSNLNGTSCFINMDTILSKEINLYSFTKSQFKESLKYLVETTDIKVVNLKLDMMYGANSGTHNFIHKMMVNLKQNVNSIELTRGEQERSFLYIKDIVSAVNLIIEQIDKIATGKFNEYHLIHPKLNTIREVMEELRELTKSITKLNFGALPYRDNEIMKTTEEYSIYKLLDWKPEFSLQDGLIDSLNYYQYE